MEQLIPLTFGIPLLVAAVLIATNRLFPKWLVDAAGILTAAAVTAMAYLLYISTQVSPLVYWFGGWTPRQGVSLGICFVVDPFSGALAALVGLLFTAALVFSWKYFESVGTLYHALMLVFLAALCGFVLSGDVFTLFVCFELMSVAAYALTAYKVEESSLEGALNFAITNSIAGYLLLFGIGLLYGRTGALNMAQIGNSLAGAPADGTVIVALVLIMCSLMVKGAIVPFHFWLDDAHAVAPTPVCVIFSGIMVEAALYAIARIYWTIFSTPMAPHAADFRLVLVIAGVVTAVVGAILCFPQRHIKRMLAFSTISHSGIILAGWGALTSTALAGAGVYLVGHGLAKAALFICAGILLHRTSSVDEIELRGKGRNMKWAGGLMVLGALGLCGVPPFGTFVGKAWIDAASGKLGLHWVAPLTALASAVTAAAVLRIAARVFLGWGAEPEPAEAASPTEQETHETESPHRKTPVSMLLAAAVLIAVCVSFAYTPAWHRTEAWAEAFQNRQAYSSHVLFGASQSFSSKESGSPFGAESLIYAAAALIVAAGLAAVSLWRQVLPDRLKGAWDRAGGPFAYGLRYLHSGQVGDYVVWQMVGFAVFSLVVFLATR